MRCSAAAGAIRVRKQDETSPETENTEITPRFRRTIILRASPIKLRHSMAIRDQSHRSLSEHTVSTFISQRRLPQSAW